MSKGVNINFDRDFTVEEKLQLAYIAEEVMENMQDKLRKMKMSDYKKVVAHYYILKMSLEAMEKTFEVVGIKRG